MASSGTKFSLSSSVVGCKLRCSDGAAASPEVDRDFVSPSAVAAVAAVLVGWLSLRPVLHGDAILAFVRL